jgi:hypothetical protein
MQDKKAFERLIEDLKDFNDGLHATLMPILRQNIDFNVCSQVSIATEHIDDLRTIQAVSPDFEMLQATASFKAFNIKLHQSSRSGIPEVSLLEIPRSALYFSEDEDIAARGVRSQAFCRLARRGSPQAALVEWKYYQPKLQARVSLDHSLQRIQRFAQLLGQKPKPKDFRTLD